MKYPALGYVGSDEFVGLYGLNETIHDQKAIGLQHFYVGDYQVDLIHTGLSVVSVEGLAYYGDRVKPKAGHPNRFSSFSSNVISNAIYEDSFMYPSFTKTDRVGALNHQLFFECEIQNTSSHEKMFDISSLVITQPNLNTQTLLYHGAFIVESANHMFAMIMPEAQTQHMSLDAPSGFMYHGIEDILFDKNRYQAPLLSQHPVAISLTQSKCLPPMSRWSTRWAILVGNNQEDLQTKIDQFQADQWLERVAEYWKHWLNDSAPSQECATMLVALKSAMMRGFLPADLTGHYFAKGNVCFYVRDALMASRAFLYSNHPAECQLIVHELLKCPRKENGEFYQRYNAYWLPDEGANNNVFSQIDVIGYFSRVVTDYYHLNHSLIVPYEELKMTIDALEHIERKHGLFGPEGGVNEGVYGPAYIVSTNMFIVGGILGAIEVANAFHHEEDVQKWTHWVQESIAGIEKTFLDENYYSYGYVDYHDEQIYRYDAPQLLAASLGYPLTPQFKHNYETLLKIASFFGEGIGYSEQEYHHGPWMFNTAAAGETAYLVGDMKTYENIRQWMLNHRNGYGLLPEAIDATNESHPFINPLMWANAEFVCLECIETIQKLRQ